MCFTPGISFATFIVESALALLILSRNPKDNLNRMVALLLFLLGLYQLNEFLICKTGMLLFTKISPMITSLLPAIGLHISVLITRKKLKHISLFYVPAAVFSVLFLFMKIVPAFCGTYFIRYQKTGLIDMMYGAYYVIYLIASLAMLYFTNLKKEQEKRMNYFAMVILLTLHVSTLSFLMLFPGFYPDFPSVYCHFAVLVAIMFFLMISYKEKHKIRY